MKLLKCILIVFILMIPAVSFAAGPNLQIYRPASDPFGLMSVQGSKTLGLNTWHFGLGINFTSKPLESTNTGIADSFLTLDLLLGVGVFEHLDLWIDVPYTAVDDPSGTFATTLSDNGLNDIMAGAKWNIYDDVFGIAFSPFIALPSGDEQNLLGDEGVGFGADLILDKHIEWFYMSLNAGYYGRSEDSSINNLRVRHELKYGTGIAADINENFAIMTELHGRASFRDKVSSPLEIVGGVRSHVNKTYFFTLGAGTGLVAGYGAPSWRAFADFRYLPNLNSGKVRKRRVHFTALPPVFFRSGSSRLDYNSQAVLDIIAHKMKQVSKRYYLQLRGHTDSTGSKTRNRRLALKRTQIVKAYLIRKGVKAEKIILEAVGEGESFSELPKQGASRRVEIRLLKSKP
jgi:outer membrane protein OmpA-like peptidoglycan-associated protein